MAESEAAVAIVHAGGPEEAVLLIRRAEREGDPWSGHWSLPGGRREPEDTDLLHTALRELEEECGIRLARDVMETALPPRLARRKAAPFLPVAPFVFRLPERLAAVTDPCEAAASLWLPLSIPRDPAKHRLTPVPGLPRTMLYPAIALDGAPLWGFTYRLLSDWLGLGPQGAAIGQAGFEAARQTLDFLLSMGLEPEGDWQDRGPAVKAVTVKGAIPAAQIVERFSVPGPHVLAVNCLEVHPDHIRIAGLLFEEYLIRVSAA